MYRDRVQNKQVVEDCLIPVYFTSAAFKKYYTV